MSDCESESWKSESHSWSPGLSWSTHQSSQSSQSSQSWHRSWVSLNVSSWTPSWWRTELRRPVSARNNRSQTTTPSRKIQRRTLSRPRWRRWRGRHTCLTLSSSASLGGRNIRRKTSPPASVRDRAEFCRDSPMLSPIPGEGPEPRIETKIVI